MGAALGVMTARYSDSSEPEHALDEVKNEFLTLVDADAEAYGQVNSAMALPKDSDDTKRRRKEALQIALGEASEVPLKGMMLAVRGLTSLADLAPRCNKNLISDLSGAATFLESALLGCGENVRINAMAMTDKVRRGRLEKEHDRLSGEGKACRSKIQQAVEQLYGRK
jgi:formiminotetrahydrofolate cyclodeaminase